MTKSARKFRTHGLVCIALSLAFLLAACSKPLSVPESKPFTIFYTYSGLRHSDFTFLRGALESKFPEYAFRYVDINNIHAVSDRSIIYSYRKFEAQGDIADLIIEPLHGSSSPLFTQAYTYNMDAALRGSSIDLNTFEQEYLDHLRGLSNDGTLLALPLSAKRFALKYSVDELPAEQLEEWRTWQQVSEASVQPLTAYNLDSFWVPISNQFGLQYLNEHDELSLNRNRWEEALRQFSAIKFSSGEATSAPTFIPISTETFTRYPSAYRNENWDLLPYPQIKDGNGIGPHRLHHIAAIGPKTNRLEVAMKVLAYLTSYEYQLAQARAGIPSVLDRPEVREQFGVEFAANSTLYTDKNIAAFFRTSPSQPPQRTSKYDRLNILDVLYPILLRMIKEPLEPSAAFDLIEKQLADRLDQLKQTPVDSY